MDQFYAAIDRLDINQTPMIGLCLGHQAIAAVLGGIIKKPCVWGRSEMFPKDLLDNCWKKDISELAECSNVVCNISGVLAYCALGTASKKTISAYINHVINAFGADQLVWGSDWPVVNLAIGVADWLDVTCQNRQWNSFGYPRYVDIEFESNAIKIEGKIFNAS